MPAGIGSSQPPTCKPEMDKQKKIKWGGEAGRETHFDFKAYECIKTLELCVETFKDCLVYTF